MPALHFKDIEFENLRKTRQRYVDLSKPGLTLVIGPNGSGKSTILDAIRLCLHDTSVKGTSPLKVLSTGADSGFSRLRLSADRTDYEITCKLTSKKTALEVVENGVSLTRPTKGQEATTRALNGKTATKKFLSSLCTKASFFNAVYFTSAKATDVRSTPFFMHLSEPDRKRFLEDFLPCLDVIQLAETLLKDERRINAAELETLTRELELFDSELKARVAEFETFKADTESDHKKLKQHTELVTAQLKKAEAWLKTARSAAQDLKTHQRAENQLREKLQREEKKRTALDERLKKLEDSLRTAFRAQHGELTALLKQNVEAVSEIERVLRKKTAACDAQFAGRLEELRRFEAKVVRAQRMDIDTVTKSLADAREAIASLQAEHRTTRREIDSLCGHDKAGWVCPTCARPGSEPAVVKRLTELATSRKRLDKKLETATARVKSFETRLQVLRHSAETTTSDIAQRRATYQSEHEDNRAALEEAFKLRLDDLKSDKLNMQARLRALEAAEKESFENSAKRITLLRQIQDQESTVQNTRKEYELAVNASTKLQAAYGASKISDMKASKTEYRKQLDDFKSSQKELTSRLRAAKKKLDDFRKTRKKDLRERKKNASARSARLKALAKAFSHKGLRAYYLDLVLPSFNRALQQHAAEIASDFRIAIYREHSAVHLEATNLVTGVKLDSFSSGEAAIVSLVVLLALRDVLSSFDQFSSNLMLFDEVFDSLDRANSMLVLEALHRLSLTKRVVLLTHNELYRNSDFADQVIDTLET